MRKTVIAPGQGTVRSDDGWTVETITGEER